MLPDRYHLKGQFSQLTIRFIIVIANPTLCRTTACFAIHLMKLCACIDGHSFTDIERGEVDVTETVDQKRRRLMLGAASMVVAVPLSAANMLLQPTPAQTAGPFYPITLPLDDDNDLTRVKGSVSLAQGSITELTGRLLDVNGRPLQDTRIEIWQCDANGRYHHPMDSSKASLDVNFQGHGHSYSSNNGWYRFRTIRPVPYPGRTPHIHITVFPAGEQPFVTQIYIKGESHNQQDFIFNRIPVEQRHLVLADFIHSPDRDTELAARFDIILGGTPGV